MARLYISDLDKVDNYAESALANEAADTDKIIGNINGFVSTKGTLTGAVWDKERERFSSYTKALEKRKAVSKSLLSAIKSANQIMRGYANGFPWSALSSITGISISVNASPEFIDDSWLGEIELALNKAKAERGKYLIEKDDTDEVKKKKNSLRGQYDTQITACETVRDYLANLQATVATAYSEYEGVVGEIASLQELNHEVNENLFDNIGGKWNKTKKVYVYVGGGNDTPVSQTSNAQEDTPTEPTTDEPVTSETPVTPTTPVTPVTPIASTPTTVTKAPTPTVSVKPTVVETKEPEEHIEVIENEPVDEPIIIDNDNPVIPADEPVVTPSYQEYQTETPRGNSTMKNIGIGLVGVAALGAAGYGTYKAAKRIKENSDLDDDVYDEPSSSYDDKENVDINYDKDNDDI